MPASLPPLQSPGATISYANRNPSPKQEPPPLLGPPPTPSGCLGPFWCHTRRGPEALPIRKRNPPPTASLHILSLQSLEINFTLILPPPYSFLIWGGPQKANPGKRFMAGRSNTWLQASHGTLNTPPTILPFHFANSLNEIQYLRDKLAVRQGPPRAAGVDPGHSQGPTCPSRGQLPEGALISPALPFF